MGEKLFEIAAKITKPVSLAAAIAIILYVIYKAVLSLPVFSALGERGTFVLLNAITEKVFYLALAALVLGIASFSLLRYQKGAAARKQPRPQPTVRTITGNVFLSDGRPIRGATVFVEGVDRLKETDASGWFSLEVGEQKAWVVHALFKDELAERVVRRADVHRPVRLDLQSTKEVPGGAQALEPGAADPPKEIDGAMLDPVSLLNPLQQALGAGPGRASAPPSAPAGDDEAERPKIVVSKVEYLVTFSGRSYQGSLKLLNAMGEGSS